MKIRFQLSGYDFTPDFTTDFRVTLFYKYANQSITVYSVCNWTRLKTADMQQWTVWTLWTWTLLFSPPATADRPGPLYYYWLAKLLFQTWQNFSVFNYWRKLLLCVFYPFFSFHTTASQYISVSTYAIKDQINNTGAGDWLLDWALAGICRYDPIF